jgi:predicted ATPase/DNA-binding CsgD family transcriptional regulator
VARDLTGRFEDGVWLVQLAALTDAGLLPRTVATTLRVQERPDRPPLEALVDRVGKQRLLLVLDNCEHLASACAALAEALLRRCADVRLLVTSREVLGVSGEVIWRLPPLSLPAPAPHTGRAELGRSEAVALFVERARAAEPSFTLAAANAPSVAEICRRLDGLPLALELAAARVRTLGPEQLASRLDDRFRVLVDGPRSSPAHHRTLLTTIDWSYALLTEAERRLFARLAVFVGGWTLEAAEAVCSDGGIAVRDILPLLGRLIDRSLVVTETGDRYRLLETLREYAADRLRTSGEAQSVAERHCDWCLDLMERFDVEWRGPAQATWFKRVEQEHANVLAVLGWCVEKGEVERGLRLASAAWRFWEVHGHLSIGRAWLARLLEHPGPASAARTRALDAAGHLAILQDDQATGVPLVERSLALAHELNDEQALANAYHSLGLAAQYRQDYSVAADMHTRSLHFARAIGDTPRTYVAIYNMAVVAQRQNDFDRATTLHEESLRLKREAGDYWSVGYSLLNLALLAWIRGESPRATALVEESLLLRRDLGDMPGIAACLEMLAELTTVRGQFKDAAHLFGAADALLQKIGVRIFAPRPAGRQRGVDTVRARLGNAVFLDAYSAGGMLPLERAIATALGAGPTHAPSPARRLGPSLTARETEVAMLVADGLTNRQIAARLTIAEGTAQRHVANILIKLGCSSRAQIVARVLDPGPAD